MMSSFGLQRKVSEALVSTRMRLDGVKSDAWFVSFCARLLSRKPLGRTERMPRTPESHPAQVKSRLNGGAFRS
jgi:hypothetical protein